MMYLFFFTYVYVDTDNQKSEDSNLVRPERNFTPKERARLCRSLFRVESMYTLIQICLALSPLHRCYIRTLCFCRKHGQRKAKQTTRCLLTTQADSDKPLGTCAHTILFSVHINIEFGISHQPRSNWDWKHVCM